MGFEEVKERKRRHDDVHHPLGGKGKRAVSRRREVLTGELCECGIYRKGAMHLCGGPRWASKKS